MPHWSFNSDKYSIEISALLFLDLIRIIVLFPSLKVVKIIERAMTLVSTVLTIIIRRFDHRFSALFDYSVSKIKSFLPCMLRTYLLRFLLLLLSCCDEAIILIPLIARMAALFI